MAQDSQDLLVDPASGKLPEHVNVGSGKSSRALGGNMHQLQARGLFEESFTWKTKGFARRLPGQLSSAAEVLGRWFHSPGPIGGNASPSSKPWKPP